jgi:hypothetical protein
MSIRFLLLFQIESEKVKREIERACEREREREMNEERKRGGRERWERWERNT